MVSKKTVVYSGNFCYNIEYYEKCCFAARFGVKAMQENRRRPDRERRPAPQPVEEIEGQLEGRNALTEALRAGRTIDKVFIASGDTDRALQRLAAEAKEAGAVIVPVDRRKLDQMSTTRSHQGVIALAAAHEYATIDDILEEAASRGENALIVICDELSDPHNLGAIMRSAECAGAHGVIIPKRRSVGLTATVAKASAGAVEYMKVARVTNINAAMAELKEKGVWIFGTAAEGSIPMYKADLTGPTAIVIGNEGDGMSPLVRKNCDVTVHIPMKGRISSLNASAAASILLYEAVRQRLQ
jgi:23S rRNA (guanosine2251-2'-O)-methyltransferase